MSTPEDPTTPAEDNTLQVKVNFSIPTNMPGRFAHHMMSQIGEGEVVLSFFESIPLPPFETDEQRKAVLERGVPTVCVARIIVPLYRFADFVNALQGTLKKIEAAMEMEGAANDTPSNTEERPTT